jgi:hypothetical protein
LYNTCFSVCKDIIPSEEKSEDRYKSARLRK